MYSIKHLTDREVNALWCALYIFNDYLRDDPFREELYITRSELEVILTKILRAESEKTNDIKTAP